ncbi:hypothetical protein [Pseudofulvimonas gallinarii]
MPSDWSRVKLNTRGSFNEHGEPVLDPKTVTGRGAPEVGHAIS